MVLLEFLGPTLVSLRVILVEDNAVLALLAEEALMAANHTVLASTGAEDEAVDLVFQHKPDLVLLDLRLSAGSGSRALKRIRAQNREVHCLLMTGRTNEGRQLAGECIGMLQKPFDITLLVAAIRVVEGVIRGQEISAEEVPCGLEMFRSEQPQIRKLPEMRM